MCPGSRAARRTCTCTRSSRGTSGGASRIRPGGPGPPARCRRGRAPTRPGADSTALLRPHRLDRAASTAPNGPARAPFVSTNRPPAARPEATSPHWFFGFANQSEAPRWAESGGSAAAADRVRRCRRRKRVVPRGLVVRGRTALLPRVDAGTPDGLGVADPAGELVLTAPDPVPRSGRSRPARARLTADRSPRRTLRLRASPCFSVSRVRRCFRKGGTHRAVVMSDIPLLSSLSMEDFQPKSAIR